MPCRKSTLKKYATRPSPPYPAQECKGTRKKGRDGQWYVSAPTAKGVYRWTKTHKANKGVKSYEIHDNGGRPFVVDVSKKEVEVFENDWREGGEYVRGKSIYRTHYKKIFLGEDETPQYKYNTADLQRKGNSILVHVSGATYVYIGHLIQSFQTHDGEAIQRYYSPIGNSDVPYPYAIGENHTYFMLDMESLPNEVLDLKMDGYPQFYGHAFENPKAYGYKEKASKERKDYFKNVVEPSKKRVPHKMIHRRRV